MSLPPSGLFSLSVGPTLLYVSEHSSSIAHNPLLEFSFLHECLNISAGVLIEMKIFLFCIS